MGGGELPSNRVAKIDYLELKNWAQAEVDRLRQAAAGTGRRANSAGRLSCVRYVGISRHGTRPVDALGASAAVGTREPRTGTGEQVEVSGDDEMSSGEGAEPRNRRLEARALFAAPVKKLLSLWVNLGPGSNKGDDQ